jgi:hypothetical protein
LLIRERQNYYGYKIQDQTEEDFTNVRRDTCRNSKKKKRDYMKTRVNSKNKNIRETYKGINEFKKGYQPRAYVIKKHGDTIVADTTDMLSRWEQFFSNLLNFNQSTNHEGSEIFVAEEVIPQPSLIEE